MCVCVVFGIVPVCLPDLSYRPADCWQRVTGVDARLCLAWKLRVSSRVSVFEMKQRCSSAVLVSEYIYTVYVFQSFSVRAGW